MAKNKSKEVQKLSPIDRHRREMRSHMSDDLGEKADLTLERKKKHAAMGVLYAYDTGAVVEEICTQEDRYGSGDIKVFAEYVGETDQTLYMMRRLNKAFTREFITQQATQPMSNGRLSSQAHWFLFAQIENEDKRIQAINRVWKLGITAPELQNELFGPSKNSGPNRPGAKVKVPTSVVGALNRGAKLCSKLTNYWTAVNVDVIETIEELPPDSVNEDLVTKLESTKQSVVDVVAFLSKTEDVIEGGLTRLRRVIGAREEIEGEAPDAAVIKVPKGKKAKVKKAKVSAAATNGKATKPKTIKKVKVAKKTKAKNNKRVPAAAT